MEIDARVAIAGLAIGVVAVLWSAALVLGRVDRKVTARGFRNGAVVAALLFIATALIVAFVFNGRQVFLVPLDLGGAIQLGVIVGAAVAAGYLLLGAALIAIGLIFKSKPQWTTAGAWAAVPVLVVAAGFGYASYKSVNADRTDASSANGSLHLALAGSGTGRIDADGAATCATAADNTLTVDAGTTADAHIVSSDGRLISAHLTRTPNEAGVGLDMSISNVDTTDMTVATDPNSGPAAGQLTVSGHAWTGTVIWSCNQ